MAVERWQLRWNRENDHLGRAAAQRISFCDAADGRRSAHRRPGVSACGVCLGSESTCTATVQPLMRRFQPNQERDMNIPRERRNLHLCAYLAAAVCGMAGFATTVAAQNTVLPPASQSD